ncbi:hypothetical protein J6590_026364 [Homalodisca vitripennis]|nr:hypothetical protein J6590_026364 [Homalodisca vitripennis]
MLSTVVSGEGLSGVTWARWRDMTGSDRVYFPGPAKVVHGPAYNDGKCLKSSH